MAGTIGGVIMAMAMMNYGARNDDGDSDAMMTRVIAVIVVW